MKKYASIYKTTDCISHLVYLKAAIINIMQAEAAIINIMQAEATTAADYSATHQNRTTLYHYKTL